MDFLFIIKLKKKLSGGIVQFQWRPTRLREFRGFSRAEDILVSLGKINQDDQNPGPVGQGVRDALHVWRTFGPDGPRKTKMGKM